MHFLMNLLRYMIPIPVMLSSQGFLPPPGFDRVITSRGGAFVVTARGNFVIAKQYV